MRNIRLIIEYDGTNYHGWQSQVNAAAVQDVIAGALRKLTGEDTKLSGAGRTDAGVHAYGQVANFQTDSRIPAEKFSYAINSMLPGDIVIKSSDEVGLDFHSRFSARGKKYKYLIYNDIHPSALLRNRAYHISDKLDFVAMQNAGPCFVGTHDFSAFRASGSSVESSVRTVTDIRLEKQGDLIEMSIAADGFLYNMVRIIAGTLVEVGTGKKLPKDIPEIIGSGDRSRAGKTAPAHGLYLVEVYF